MMRGLREMTWLELKLFLREPLTVVFTLGLPILLMLVLGAIFGGDEGQWDGAPAMESYVPAYVGLVAASMGLIGLPVHLAAYREQGALRRFRASGMPLATVLGSQLIKTCVVAIVGAAVVVMLGRVVYDVGWPRDPQGVVFAFVLGVLAFAAVGLLLGTLIPTTRAAQGAGVTLWFVALLTGGAGPPADSLTQALRLTGDLTLLRHVVIALQDPWLGSAWHGWRLLAVSTFVVVPTGFATWRLRQDAAENA